jgi:hypothetical protein
VSSRSAQSQGVGEDGLRLEDVEVTAGPVVGRGDRRGAGVAGVPRAASDLGVDDDGEAADVDGERYPGGARALVNRMTPPSVAP